MSDIVIQDLVRKKKELLDELLRQSIQSMINSPNLERILVRRNRILGDLRRTDSSLQIRESETGISALRQEENLYQKISQIISSIQANNIETIGMIEQEMAETGIERSVLDKERQLSGYIQQRGMHQNKRSVMRANYR